MTPRNLTQLQHKLRKGSSPDELNARRAGQGIQKTAYAVTMRLSGTTYIVLRKYGCDTIYQIRAGNWIIQELVTVLAEIDGNHPAWKVYREIRRQESGDYHCKNFGIREDGSLVCFDW